MQTSGDLAEERMTICKSCPLYYESHKGPVCNSNLWMNKDGVVSSGPRPSFIRGCGCKILYKTKQPSSKCVAGKW